MGGGAPTLYAYASTSNRLLSVGTRTITHNAAGSITGDGYNTFTYDARGRLVKAARGTPAVEYNLDAFGQRVLSLVSSAYAPIQSFSAAATTSFSTAHVPSGRNAFVYDETARLIGEYDVSDLPLAEHLYLGSLPVATLRGEPGATEIFYVHADPIGRPAAITDTAGALRWRWDTEPFGSTLPQQNPQGLGGFRHNPRFPGQFYDSISRTNYNYFRDYDPSIGRYIQSDPIGLAGGINTYGYVASNPLRFTDPRGLEYEPADPGVPAPWLLGIYVHNAFSTYAEGLGLSANRQHGVGTGRPDAFDPSGGFVWELKPRSYQTGYKYTAAAAQVDTYCGPTPSGAVYQPGHANQILRGQPNVNLTVNYFGINYNVTVFADPRGPVTSLLFYDYSPASGGGGGRTAQDPFGSRSPAAGPLPPMLLPIIPIP